MLQGGHSTVIRSEINYTIPGSHPGIPLPDLGLYRLEAYPGQNLEFGYFLDNYDSLSIAPHPGLAINTGSVPYSKIFAPGFNLLNPLGNNKFSFSNRRNGCINLELDSIGDYHYALELSYYNFDANTNNFILQAKQIVDFAIYCRNPIRLGSTTAVPIVNPQLNLDLDWHLNNGLCWKNKIRILANKALKPLSLSADGSQFRLQKQNQTLPVIGAKWVGIDSIEIELLHPLSSNGNYQLSIHQGLDGKRLRDFCGSSVALDTILITINDCLLSINETSHPKAIFPNPCQATVHLPDRWTDATRVAWIDLHGKLIQEQNFQSQVEAPAAKGLYLLVIFNDRGQRLYSQRVLRN